MQQEGHESEATSVKHGDADELVVPSFSELDPPTSLLPSSRGLELQWKEGRQLVPDPTAGPDVPRCRLQYSLEMQQVHSPFAENSDLPDLPEDRWQCRYTGPDVSAEVDGLRPRQQYAFRVRLIPQSHPELQPPPAQQPSQAVLCTTTACEPSPPLPPVSGKRERYAMTCKWKPPDETGGYPITGYQLVFCQWQAALPQDQQREALLRESVPAGGFQNSAYDGLECRHRIPRLISGHSYAAAVRASNGKFWIYTGPATQHEVPNLKSGRKYQVRITAFNMEGRSDPSAPAEVTTAPDVPAAPYNLRYKSGTGNSVIISWSLPSENGGAAVTGYETKLEVISGSAAAAGLPLECTIDYQNTLRQCTVSRLQPGTGYRAWIRSKNSAGFSQYSQPITVTTSKTLPARPRNPHAFSQGGSLQFSWDAPEHDGGSAITSYHLELQAASADEAVREAAPRQQHDVGLQCSANISSVVPATDYMFQVAAVNSVGRSPLSEPCIATTAAAPPAQPEPPRLREALPKGLHLQWDPPATFGAPVTGYDAASDIDHFEQASAVSNGDEPLHRTQAAGAPALSNGQKKGRRGRHPGGQAHERDETSAGGVHVHRIQAHEVDRRISGLEAYTDYEVRLRAKSEAGPSDWSTPVSMRTAPGVPDCPVHVRVGGTHSNALDVSWLKPNARGSTISKYGVEYQYVDRSKTEGKWRHCASVETTSAQVTGLKPARTYKIRVCASNGHGSGAWSEAVKWMTKAAAPDAPDPPTLRSRSATSVIVHWKAPEEDGGEPDLSYQLRGSAEGQSQATTYYNGSATQFKVTNLRPGTHYTFEVQARTKVGASEWSDSAAITMRLLPPQPPSEVCVAADEQTATDPSGTRVSVWWTAAEASSMHAEWQGQDPAGEAAGPGRNRQHPGSMRVVTHSISKHHRGRQASEPKARGPPIRRTLQGKVLRFLRQLWRGYSSYILGLIVIAIILAFVLNAELISTLMSDSAHKPR
ncbi:hypothetical protein WJX73_010464 [Symbiochloris irregularis]|uniref:Fibronectin type-III domain-containing protein n=1 Tax=Symbiochloris irregularis TaxID=706552 RepID=A0AAW1PD02_9CHLO